MVRMLIRHTHTNYHLNLLSEISHLFIVVLEERKAGRGEEYKDEIIYKLASVFVILFFEGDSEVQL